MSSHQTRYLLFDTIRGVAVINMILYHLSFDIFALYGVDPQWVRYPAVYIWQQCICASFILVSGFVWSFGKKTNFRRGCILNLWGLVITAVTALIMPDFIIIFGILNFIGCAILITIPADRFLRQLPPAAGIIISLLLFVMFRNIYQGYIGIGSRQLFILPEKLCQIKLLIPLGFPSSGFFSSDYVPVLPWIFLFLTGYYLHSLFQKHSTFKDRAGISVFWLTFIGQHSLPIYLLHQPLCLGLCILLFS